MVEFIKALESIILVNNRKSKDVDIDELIGKYKACKDENEKRRLYIKITLNGLNLVKRIAVSVAIHSNSPAEDLIQVGALGLIKAIDFYVPNKNAKFLTYATHFIKGEIKHYVRDKANMIKTPRKIQELFFKIQTASKELVLEGFEEPTTKQIAERINLPQEKVEEILKIDKYKATVSLDQNLSQESEETTLIDKIPSGDYQEFLSSYEDKIMIEEAIQKLPDDLKKILEMSFFDELNQREIAEQMNISQMQVSRRLKKALNKMYDLIKRK